MNRQYFTFVILLIIAALIGVGLWQFKQPLSTTAKAASTERSVESGDMENHMQPPSHHTASVTDEEAQSEGLKEEDTQSLDQLSELLPDWLREGGMQLQDRRVINGQTVLRSRGRYEWGNGEQLEIEITDAGTKADGELLKSLGFDLALADIETDSGFTMTQDTDGYLINHEYDYNDQAGSMQLLIEDRYLIEIQIQNLPPESFQEVLDADISFDKIFNRLNK